MRSVVLKPSVRCARCHLPPRWCICDALQPIGCPLAIDVLMHHREQYRPSSTGHLIHRAIPGTGLHLWRQERGMTLDELRRPGRELWVLHAQGAPAPTDMPAERIQAVLLDGSWREATTMAQSFRGDARLVSLPMLGVSRYWLRTQPDEGRFSTVEALLFLLQQLGLGEVRAALRLQFELHVYASLRARGQKETAEAYLRDSPLGTAMPEVLARLNVRRPREELPRRGSDAAPGEVAGEGA